jgi:hypothetical protein
MVSNVLSVKSALLANKRLPPAQVAMSIRLKFQLCLSEAIAKLPQHTELLLVNSGLRGVRDRIR